MEEEQQTNGKLISRQQLTEQASDLPHEDVPIESLGGSVRVRQMTCAVRDKYLTDCMNDEIKTHEERLHFLRLCLVDENNVPMFGEDPNELVELGKLDHRVLDKLTDVAKRINWLNPDSLELATKNSETDPG